MKGEPEWWTPGRGPRPPFSRGVDCGLLGCLPVGPSCCLVEPRFPCCPERVVDVCCYCECGKLPVCVCCGPECSDCCCDCGFCDCAVARNLRDCCDCFECCGTCECARYVGCDCCCCKFVCLYFPVCLWPCGPSICSCCVEDRLTADGRLLPVGGPPGAQAMEERDRLFSTL